MNRDRSIAAIRAASAPVDIVVIGGGANGAGIALDAASRGLSVVLLERADFGNGTSSRSSKLIHGGVRYLASGQFGLVREALRERALLLRNAPAIVTPLPFVMPAANRLELLKFGVGLKLYDGLAGARGLRPSARLSVAEARREVPGLSARDLVGAVCYEDAQFDDVRLLLAILRRAAECAAILLNYAEVTALLKDARGKLCAIVATDGLNGDSYEIPARCVINATGTASDRLRRLDDDDATAGVQPSQGAHIVVRREFLGGTHALVLPRTPDRRIMFAIPWLGHVLLGTTDTALADASEPPLPRADEIEMILAVAARFLDPAPTRADVLSCFAGIRPLAAPPGTKGTAKVSREHAIHISASGLVSVNGGKWTTYRMVAEHSVDAAVRSAHLRAGHSVTRDLCLAALDTATTGDAARGPGRGTLAQIMVEQPALALPLHPALPYCGAHFARAAREEMAVSVADALAYRTRALFIDAAAAAAIAPQVAAIMAAELARDARWVEQQIVLARAAAASFCLTPTPVRAASG